MHARLIPVLSVLCMGLSVHGFSDSVWVVSTVGEPGQLMPVEIWMEYEGGGSRDSVSAFDILLSFDARVCTVEAYALGQDFSKWTNQSRIDNRGIQEPPAVSKIDLSAFTFGPPVGVPFVARGRHLAATVDFRILKTVKYGHFTYIDTLLQAFAPPLYLGFVDKGGANTYLPKYAGGWITALAERGDVGPIAMTSPPDTVEAKDTYIPSVTVKNFEADSTVQYSSSARYILGRTQ